MAPHVVGHMNDGGSVGDDTSGGFAEDTSSTVRGDDGSVLSDADSLADSEFSASDDDDTVDLGIFSALAHELFSVDVRALAAWRIGLAAVVLGSLFQLSPSHWLSDVGVLPRDQYLKHQHERWHFSVYLATGDAEWAACLMFLEALCAGFMLVG